MEIKNLNKLVAEKLFKLISYIGKENDQVFNYVNADGILYPLKDYCSNFCLLEELFIELEKQGIVVKYSTMKNGKRGHFITLFYCKNSFDSFFTEVIDEGSTLPEALCRTIIKL